VKKHQDRPQINQLKKLLDAKLQAVTDQAVQTAGQVPADEWIEISRLREILGAQDEQTNRRPRRKRWIVASFLLTLAVISLLLFARVPHTDIELEVSLSALSFRVPRTQSIMGMLRLRSLGVAGLQQVRLPRSLDSTEQVLTASAPGLALSLVVDTGKGGQPAGTIDLDGIDLAGATDIQVSETTSPGQYQVSLQHKTVELQASVGGVMIIGASNAPTAIWRFPSPQPVGMTAGLDGIDLDLTPLTPIEDLFSEALEIDSLSLMRIDEAHEAENTLYRRLSTIHSGKLYFSSLGGDARVLRGEEELRFASAVGNIRTVCSREGHLFLDFHGQATGMTTGVGPNQTSLMPTWLDWLKARHGLSLLWGSTLYIFGLMLGLIRWWREEK
jgi:hypothetical protein